MSAKASKVGADWNLLFGMLAVNLDLVRRDALVAALRAWSRDKNKNVADILLSQGAIDRETQSLLDAVVKKHLSVHENSLDRSLSSTQPDATVRRDLEVLGDAELIRALKKLDGGDGRHDERDPLATQADPLETIDQIPNRFQVVRLHARGGLGEVFMASDRELDRTVALKEIQRQYADHPDSRARFVREAKLTGKLKHPGIVPVYSLGRFDDGRLYYAMRLIEGHTFKEAIAEFHARADPRRYRYESLEFRRLLGKFVEVCTTLEFAHSRGVLHRDIKPGNVMLGPHGETLVVELGPGQGVQSGGDGVSSGGEIAGRRPQDRRG